jgi:hypothetical protein
MQNTLEDYMESLQTVNLQIAELRVLKEEIEKKIIEGTGQAIFDGNQVVAIDKNGSTTHKDGKYKATIRTEYLYSINKKEYESIKQKLTIDPVDIINTYKVNKKKLLQAQRIEADKNLISAFLSIGFSKPNVKVEVI